MPRHLSPNLAMTALSAVLAVCLLSVPALAQEVDEMVFCEYYPDLEDLIGEYTFRAGPSTLVSRDGTVVLPDVQSGQVSVFMLDGSLVLVGDGRELELRPMPIDYPNVEMYDDFGDLPVLAAEDIGIVLGCDETSLRRLAGDGFFTSQEGIQAPFQAYLFAVVEGMLTGRVAWTYGGMTMLQNFVLEKVGD
ncbi:hypothetical protein V6617_16935 [Pelagibacterium nitratireducens]|uniref:Uncharacterized protein n=1 Tax=Pelagibacterium nitratireducens TaxID=1046114 RepID=A0ABZ2HYH1_9HYPH